MSYDPKKIDLFPTLPGVYLMKDEQGDVLYVGKAKNLRQRVKQYFVPGRDGRLMIPFLVAKIILIETIVVTSEKEALLLESNLIKQYKPRYNALLKDDKSYIALKIAHKDEWPTVRLVRYKGSPEPDGLYFGPYTSAQAARQTLDLLNRLFPLRQCSDQEFARRVRPCLLYQMKRCAGPCGSQCTKDDYNQHLDRTIKFLRGQNKEVLKDLHDEMRRYVQELEFERADQILKTIRYIEKTIESQYVDRPLGHDADAVGLFRHGDDVVLTLLLFRGGRLVGTRHFEFNHIAEEDHELLASFLLQHYDGRGEIPPDILLPVKMSDEQPVEDILSSRRGNKVTLHVPQRGEKKVLLEMAYTNAEALFKTQKDEVTLREKTLLEMQERFSLTNYPTRIECFDNSNIAGAEPVSSMVAFTNGLKDSKRYRTYRLKIGSKPDDYAAMQEVLMRRYRRAKEENDLPDLVVVDGGKGQLNVALKVFEELNVTGVDIIGLAKEQGRHDKGMTAEQVFLPEQKDPIVLKSNSPVLFLLQKIRDEAHRVAISFHRKRRSKTTLRSALDDIPGIGPARRKALLTHFGSLKKVELASDEELKGVKGISMANIAAIKAFFQGRKE
ncbi:UvrABC system protein C [Candidatus Protochlamydia naegleriophila]|uniref:UvrABC system protein C n=1 Tax=Candidatus Protochlamydia naegleriophila TaxID=389348 RepID=A0A0U5JB80_9BACT|nr:excinuclease ABC subunit UvrC [Candidatus Protochlamydia naegleriophila]CUI17096.1 UvrABC system protein C [Candidatus Protochlamydia naegleriophila]